MTEKTHHDYELEIHNLKVQIGKARELLSTVLPIVEGVSRGKEREPLEVEFYIRLFLAETERM